jgi:hypothetical protein
LLRGASQATRDQQRSLWLNRAVAGKIAIAESEVPLVIGSRAILASLADDELRERRARTTSIPNATRR